MVKSDENKKMKYVKHGGGGAVYGLGFVGALFYFLGNAHSFVDVVVGILKSCLWPAFLIFKLLVFLKV